VNAGFDRESTSRIRIDGAEPKVLYTQLTAHSPVPFLEVLWIHEIRGKKRDTRHHRSRLDLMRGTDTQVSDKPLGMGQRAEATMRLPC